jgi:hypothetical protein
MDGEHGQSGLAFSDWLFCQEGLAGGDLLDEVVEIEVLGDEGGGEIVDGFFVGEFEGAAEGVGEELGDEGAGELIAF